MSAFLARGLCADLLRLVLTWQTLVTSEVVLAELRDVLSRKGCLPVQQIEVLEATPEVGGCSCSWQVLIWGCARPPLGIKWPTISSCPRADERTGASWLRCPPLLHQPPCSMTRALLTTRLG